MSKVVFDFELSDKESRKRAFRELRRVLEMEKYQTTI